MEAKESLGNFSEEVFNYMKENNIMPSPKNYEYYFEELIKKKTVEEKNILSMFTECKTDLEENILELTYTIKSGFQNIRKLNKISKNIYLNNKKIQTLIENKRTQELLNSKLYLTFKKFSNILKQQNEEIKLIEDSTINILQTLKNKNIYNEEYKVYNIKHISSLINKEIELLNNNNLHSTLIFLKIKEDILNNNNKEIINRLLASTIKKSARNSDSMGYIGNDTFIMLLTQTNLKEAKKAKKRITKLIEDTILFIEEKEIKLELNIKERALTENSNLKEILMTISKELEKQNKRK